MWLQRAYNLFIGTLTVPKRTVVGAAANNANKKVIIKNCAPFTDCISEIDTLVDNAKDVDVVIPMYNLIVYSDNYSKRQKVYGNTIEMNQL